MRCRLQLKCFCRSVTRRRRSMRLQAEELSRMGLPKLEPRLTIYLARHWLSLPFQMPRSQVTVLPWPVCCHPRWQTRLFPATRRRQSCGWTLLPPSCSTAGSGTVPGVGRPGSTLAHRKRPAACCWSALRRLRWDRPPRRLLRPRPSLQAARSLLPLLTRRRACRRGWRRHLKRQWPLKRVLGLERRLLQQRKQARRLMRRRAWLPAGRPRLKPRLR